MNTHDQVPQPVDLTGVKFKDDTAPSMETGQKVGITQSQPVDLSGIQFRPTYASGLTPYTAINQSPLSPTDRERLQYSNDAGKFRYLKERFEDVRKEEDGTWLVKNKGLWYHVDGSAFEGVDAWTASKGILKAIQALALRFGPDLPSTDPRSKYMGKKAADQYVADDPVARELLSEILEQKNVAASVGLGIAAGVATGGASAGAQILAQGGAALASAIGRTSLGRLEGTYEATPEEQAKDVALETIFSMAGASIPFGVRWSTEAFAKHLPGVQRMLNIGGSALRERVKQFYSMLTGASGDSIDTIAEQGSRVASVMKSVNRKVGGDGAKFADEIALTQTNIIKRIAEEASELPKEVYRAQQRGLVSSVSRDFTGNIDDVLDDVLSKAVNDGLVVVRSNPVYRVTTDGIQTVTKPKVLSPDEALRVIADNDGILPKGFQFEVASQGQVRKFIKTTGETGDAFVGFDDTAYSHVRDFFKTLIEMRGIRGLRGRAGAEQVLNTNRVLGDLTYKLGQSAKDANINSIAVKMAQYHDLLKNGIAEKFALEGLENQFLALNRTYSSLQNELLQITKAVKSADGRVGDQAFDQLRRKFLSRGGANTQVKQSFDAALAIAEKYGSTRAAKIRQLQDHLRVYQAALEFNPWVPSSKFGAMSMKGMAVTAGMALATSNPLPFLGNIAMAGAASPKAGFYTVRGLDAAWALQQRLNTLSRSALKKLTDNPAIMAKLFDSVFQAVALEEQTQEQLTAPLRQQGMAK